MSIRFTAIKTNCLLWKNIELPKLGHCLKSPDFLFDEFTCYFEVDSSSKEYKNIFGATKCGDAFQFTMKSSNKSHLDNYIVIPYLESKEGYIRKATTIKGTYIFRYELSDVDKITMLFFISPYYLHTKQKIKETLYDITEENTDSDEKSIEPLCLKGLSEDIGKLFNDVESADATLKCADKSFSVHRKILAARSVVFSAMFKHDLSEKNTGVVDIVDLDSNVLEQFLQYLYTGEVKQMSMDIALEMYRAAEKYSVSTLKQLCASYILDNMSGDRVYEVLILADKTRDVKFMDGITSFAVKIEGLLKSSEWEEFAEKFPNLALKVYFKYHKQMT